MVTIRWVKEENNTWKNRDTKNSLRSLLYTVQCIFFKYRHYLKRCFQQAFNTISLYAFFSLSFALKSFYADEEIFFLLFFFCIFFPTRFRRQFRCIKVRKSKKKAYELLRIKDILLLSLAMKLIETSRTNKFSRLVEVAFSEIGEQPTACEFFPSIFSKGYDAHSSVRKCIFWDSKKDIKLALVWKYKFE